MDLKEIKEVMKKTDGEMMMAGDEKKRLISILNDKDDVNTASALQLFLDHIPITSIPCIYNSPGVELKSGDSVRDAIQLLYQMELTGAPISHVPDSSEPEIAVTLSSDHRYIGFIDLPSIILWCLEECEKALVHDKDEVQSIDGFFSMLDRFYQIGDTKIGELGKAFLWDPFIAVHIGDTLLRVLLLLAKHNLQVVPVMDRSKPLIVGFVTQNAVIQVLLQSSGLDWFDQIADTPVSEFHFLHDERGYVYGDQSVDEAMHILQKQRKGVIAVICQDTKRVIGSFSKTDMHLLLDNDRLFNHRMYGSDSTLSARPPDTRKMRVEEFIHEAVDDKTSDQADTNPSGERERDPAALFYVGSLRLRNKFHPKMDSPTTNKKTDTLKQVMEKMVETTSNFSFLVDGSEKFLDVITMQDVIIQFAPPSVDTKVGGGLFFEFALQQSGLSR